MIARIIKKIHVPAKLPEDEGVQPLENSGVSWAFLNTIDMLIELEELILFELELVLLISMPSMIDRGRECENERNINEDKKSK